MASDRTELKACLMAETGAVIDEWRASEAVHAKMKLSISQFHKYRRIASLKTTFLGWSGRAEARPYTIFGLDNVL